MHTACLAACEEADELHNAACVGDEYSPQGELLNPAPGIEYEEEA